MPHYRVRVHVRMSRGLITGFIIFLGKVYMSSMVVAVIVSFLAGSFGYVIVQFWIRADLEVSNHTERGYPDSGGLHEFI